MLPRAQECQQSISHMCLENKRNQSTVECTELYIEDLEFDGVGVCVASIGGMDAMFINLTDLSPPPPPQ